MTFRQEGPAVPDPPLTHPDPVIEDLFRLSSSLAGAGWGGGEGDGALEGAFGAAPSLECRVEAGGAVGNGEGLFGGEADLELVGAFAKAVVGVGFGGEVEGEGGVGCERYGGGGEVGVLAQEGDGR